MAYCTSKKTFFHSIHKDDSIFDMKSQGEVDTYDRIIQRIGPGQKWVDDTDYGFVKLPNFANIPKFVNPEQISGWSGVRPSLLKQNHGELTAIHFTDIQQGKLGDGWFLSALVALTKNNLLNALIRRSDEEKGVYEFRFFRFEPGQGFQPVDVCVDRRVPVLPMFDDYPCFCYSDDVGELWPTLIEKAFAKLIKGKKGKPGLYGFGAMEGGITSIALSHMTGGKSEMFEVTYGARASDMYEDFNRRLNMNKELMTVTFRALEPEERVTGPLGFGHVFKGRQGLVAKHAYTVFGASQFHSAGTKVSLLQLRNPYGKLGKGADYLEWKGEWGDDSYLWDRHRDIAGAVGKSADVNDGVFFMSFEDAVREVSVFHACSPNYSFLQPFQQPYSSPYVPSFPKMPPSPMAKPIAQKPMPVPRPQQNIPWYNVREFFTDTREAPHLELFPSSCFENFQTIVQKCSNVQWIDNVDLNLPRHYSNGEEPPQLRFPHEIHQWIHHGVTPYLMANPPGMVSSGSHSCGWFSSALQVVSILGHERVHQTVGRTDEREGVFEFKFNRWQQGSGWVPMSVCVDSRLPISSNSMKAAFSHSEIQGELWPTLLEKAFVKAIEWKLDAKGRPVQGFSAVSNCKDFSEIPTCVGVCHLLGGKAKMYTVIHPVPAHSLKALLLQHVQDGHAVVIRWRNIPDTRNAGLIPNVSYYLLDLKTIEGFQVTIAQLRHPNGSAAQPNFQWNGPWSSRNPIWKDNLDIAEQCGFDEAVEDGQFFMPTEEVAKFIEVIEVCDLPPPPPVTRQVVQPYTQKGGALIVQPQNDELDRLRRELESEREARKVYERLYSEGASSHAQYMEPAAPQIEYVEQPIRYVEAPMPVVEAPQVEYQYYSMPQRQVYQSAPVADVRYVPQYVDMPIDHGVRYVDAPVDHGIRYVDAPQYVSARPQFIPEVVQAPQYMPPRQHFMHEPVQPPMNFSQGQTVQQLNPPGNRLLYQGGMPKMQSKPYGLPGFNQRKSDQRGSGSRLGQPQRF